MNAAKCVFGARELEFLGHCVMSEGIKPLEEKVTTVQNFEVPKSVRALQRFLGMLNFYRRFLPNIAEVLLPLTDALAGAPKQLVWTTQITSAFKEVKSRLARATLLAHPIPGTQLRLSTDASERAIAGALHQLVDGKEQPLAFFSRKTTAAESRYSAYDLELLAVYASILHFRHVLEGREFKIFTDQKPLTRAFLKARNPVSSWQHHQLSVISEFCTDIAHVPGVDNVVADTLSRQHNNDDDGVPVAIQEIAHVIADVDLDKLAADQPDSPVVASSSANSLRLQQLRIPGCSWQVWCDTLQGRVRFSVPKKWREKIFHGVHGLSHPSGRATVAILSRS